MRIGIDFGTTRTVVCAVRDGNYPIAAFDIGGEFREHVPGIAVLVDGELLVGWAAARALADGTAQHAIRSIKRVAGTLAPDAEVEGLPGVTALALVTAFLADLRRQLVETSNLDIAEDEPLEAMLAVPANSPSRQRWLTLEAARRAGFTPVGLLNEPTAAAVEFAQRHLGGLGKKSPKRYVVVYDLGGGTFDTSAVSLEGRRFDLIASAGLARVGGDDFDALILDVAGLAPEARDARMLERAREAKETLRPTTRKLLLDIGPLVAEGSGPVRATPGATPAATAKTIDVAELYARAQPLIDRTLAQVDALFDKLRARGIDPDDSRELGGLYLVGGGAAFPAVGRALRGRFGKKLQLAAQPFAATALGLAIAADPAAHVIIREAITRHFGVWREADHGVDKVFDPILGKDLAPDGDAIVVERRYRPTHSVGHLRFLECGALDAAGQPVQDLVPWTDVYFPYDPALAERETLDGVVARRDDALRAIEIAETYTYRPDGTIQVRIANVSHGYERVFDLGALR